MKIAVVQLNSQYDINHNIKVIDGILREIKLSGGEMAFLPECFLSMGQGSVASKYLVEGEGEYYQRLQKFARDHSLYIVGGSAATKVGGAIMNRAYNFDPSGRDLGLYDKNHLFACRLEKKSITESDIYTAGVDQKILEIDQFKIGLGICFDIRFAEHSAYYRKHHCDIITYASAFTVPTGKAHWHILNRARAIESQAYVVASAQVGVNNETVTTYGHSLIVDPWGEILIDLGERPDCYGLIEIDADRIKKVRNQVLMN